MESTPATDTEAGSQLQTRTSTSLRDGLARLHKLQALPLREKIAYSQDLIQKALTKAKVPAVAFSGGKDSTVLLHLVLACRPDVPVVFVNTGVEWPESVAFVHRLKDEWQLNLYEAKPDRGVTFWKIVQKHGWPLLGKQVSGIIDTIRKGGAPGSRKPLWETVAATDIPISNRCCRYLKEIPSNRVYRALGSGSV